MTIELTEFARARLFDPNAFERGVVGTTAEEFVAELNRRPPLEIREGYAPFCRLHLHENWTQTRSGTIEITSENEHLLRSAYEARTDDELPVLVRWFEGIQAPLARYLFVILYDREQLAREGESMTADWGIVGVLATMEPVETPMAPITMMRNALGVDEGGSGVDLDRASYLSSVAYWDTHANVRSTSLKGDA